MTVSESIIRWLKGFSDDRKLKSIHTERLSSETETWALVKEPVQNVKAYLSGKKEYTEHYTLRARLPGQNNTDRIDNGSFGEELQQWVAAQDACGNYPEVVGGRVQEISVTTPFYVGKTETDNSIYQMTIAIRYLKEK